MEKWNEPVIEELDVLETRSGRNEGPESDATVKWGKSKSPNPVHNPNDRS